MNRPVHGEFTRVAREDRGLTRVTPADITGRNAAIGRADVLADREVEVVTAQAAAVVTRRVPELREARIEIEYAFRRSRRISGSSVRWPVMFNSRSAASATSSNSRYATPLVCRRRR